MDSIRRALQVFDIPYVMTSGGPGYASSTFTLYTIDTAFKTKADMVNTSPLLLPPMERITMENFQKVLGDKYLLIGFKNTGIILPLLAAGAVKE